jgi:hypothetical protein
MFELLVWSPLAIWAVLLVVLLIGCRRGWLYGPMPGPLSAPVLCALGWQGGHVSHLPNRDAGG